MRHVPSPRIGRIAGSLALALAFISSATTARANVYASDIKLNGSLTAGTIVPGGSLTISYILNDKATGGVWVRIYSGTNVIQTLASTNGNAGTNAGLNSAIWHGSTDLAAGVYTVSITAASAGYSTWTNITDNSSNFAVAAPRGISVNRNTNSPFYGRVYVGNAYAVGGNPPGSQVGIYKFNADGSPADDGGFSTGGWGWAGEDYSPWKMTIGADDRLYVDDFANQGVVVSFDPIIETNNWRQVIRTDNYPVELDPNLELSGLAFTGTGANTQIWMTDEYPYGSAGIIGWQIGTNGVAATNDTGTVIVPVDSNFLTQAPYDLAVDSNGFIYTIQFITPYENSAYALMRFPPYEGEQETNANWAIGFGNATLLDAYGVAVDPTATYVAVAVVGSCDTETSPCGGLYLYRATNGQFIANLDETGGDPYYDVAWDNVGNLYTLDGNGGLPAFLGLWRAYSPPGTNQATTVAVAQVTVPTPFTITGITASRTTPGCAVVAINFTAPGNPAPSAFRLIGSASVNGIYTVVAGATITGGAGTYQATVTNCSTEYYQIEQPAQ